jgi:hypothetical protein
VSKLKKPVGEKKQELLFFCSDHWHAGNLIKKGTCLSDIKLEPHTIESLIKMNVLIKKEGK